MRARRGKKRLSRLIPKNHFCSFSLFRAPPLVDWPFTKSVLFTAYDVFRSNDFWIDQVMKKGMTLKEGLIESGFPKNVSLLADTGIFEIEARKAGIARKLGIEVQIELSNEQIFEAYEMSGADMFVAPDEIILPTDDSNTIRSKVNTIKENLTSLLERVKPKDVVAVIQGSNPVIIDELLEFYRKHRINHFALGGVIPLYHFSKTLLEKTLNYVRKATRNEWLHIFGLPRAGLLHYYLNAMDIDSVDTSLLLYLSARRKYLNGLEVVPVREASFEDCDCEGCIHLSSKMNPRSKSFFMNLYIHNLTAAARYADSAPKPFTKRKSVHQLIKPEPAQGQDSIPQEEEKQRGWMTAMDLLHHRNA